MEKVKALIEIDTDMSLRSIAENIEIHAPGYGFMVMVFPFGGNERVAHYISNANRSDMIRALRETADVLEQGLDIDSSGPIQ